MPQMTDHASLSSNGSPDQLLETLGRLSKKAGVLATIVLDRSSGAILKTTGSLASSRVSVSSNASTLNSSVSTSEESSGGSRELQGIEEMAEMAWNFTKSAGELVQGLDIEDEMKLLRLRTKKYELVIVPDAKYLLLVVHETPAA